MLLHSPHHLLNVSLDSAEVLAVLIGSDTFWGANGHMRLRSFE